MRPLTMLPSRKSGIAFAITSCICTINNLPPRGVAALSSSTGFFRKANCGKRSATVGVFAPEVNSCCRFMFAVRSIRLTLRQAVERSAFSFILERMSILRFAILATAMTNISLSAQSLPEQKVVDAIKLPGLSVVHLWAPWCSNCQAELKKGGWLKTVKENPDVKFYFVAVWNDGGDGKTMLQKFLEDSKSEWSHKGDPKLEE